MGSQRVRHIWASNTHTHIDEHSPRPSSVFPTWASTPRWIFQAVQSSAWRTEYSIRTQAGRYRKSLYVTHPEFLCGAFRVFPFLRVHCLSFPHYFYPIDFSFAISLQSHMLSVGCWDLGRKGRTEKSLGSALHPCATSAFDHGWYPFTTAFPSHAEEWGKESIMLL